MINHLSRRRFLQNLTAAGGAAWLDPVSRAAKPRHKSSPVSVTREQVGEQYRHQEEYQRLIEQPVYRATIIPHWLPGNTRFWYRNDGPRRTKEFILVDAERGTRQAAFDHKKLAAALMRATGTPHRADRLPFDAVEFTDDGRAIRFAVGDSDWQCDLASFVCTPLPPGTLSSPKNNPAENPPPDQPAPQADEADGLPSPDGQWVAFIQGHNVHVRAKGDPQGAALTQDGTAEVYYEALSWAPDSQALAGVKTHFVPIKSVYMVESSPKDGGTRGVLHQHEYAQPGDPFTTYEIWVFSPAAKTATKAQTDVIDSGDRPDFLWKKDSRRFTYEKSDRGHQRFRVIEVDSRTGETRNIIDERAKTFINDYHPYISYPQTDKADEIIYASERDGWRHLYRYDRDGGRFENQITRGDWVVREVDRVDADARQIWFRASGKNPGEDPYLMHHYRVDFDGTGLTALTEGDGTHFVQWSPDRRYLIDTYSRADLPPVHALRRASDGARVCALEKADISALTGKGWRMSEVFAAKGRDGVTDIWGMVCRPLHFDPARKYPIIENIYAGPHDSFTRKAFAVYDSMQALAELGFVVIQCDGMGTRNRSKAFHDVCWHNVADAGFPDRIPWMQALARKDPACDTRRVGIYGTSAGGQSATGALLFHPEFYHVAVSACGCHDNRIDKASWNEQWMGYPVGPWYAENSNITHAANLRGRLLLIVGELDTNVPPESTLRLTDALIKAGKDYELIVVTGSDHTDGGPYGERRRRDFFVRHLLGMEPPDRNIPVPPPTPVQLTPLPAGAADEAQASGGEGTTIRFTNHAGQPVTLFWLSGDGSRKKYATLAPGETYVQNTYAGHWWLVVGQDGRPRAVFVGDPRPGLAEIR